VTTDGADPVRRQGPAFADIGGERLVEVAYATSAAEGEMIQGLLLNEEIPSILQPVGLAGPQVGIGAFRSGWTGGSRRVMVHAGRADEARALLAETMIEDEESTQPEIANAKYLEEAGSGSGPRSYGRGGAYLRIYFWGFGAMALAFAVFLLLRAA
jgi:hypothetical protein